MQLESLSLRHTLPFQEDPFLFQSRILSSGECIRCFAESDDARSARRLARPIEFHPQRKGRKGWEERTHRNLNSLDCSFARSLHWPSSTTSRRRRRHFMRVGWGPKLHSNYAVHAILKRNSSLTSDALAEAGTSSISKTANKART